MKVILGKILKQIGRRIDSKVRGNTEVTKLTSLYETETRFPGIILVIAVATEMDLRITGGVKQSHHLRFSRVVIVVVRVVVCVGQ